MKLYKSEFILSALSAIFIIYASYERIEYGVANPIAVFGAIFGTVYLLAGLFSISNKRKERGIK
jgi:hypothetical protein